ncbi:MAG: glycosyltransferase family 39 protein [Candidatus Pacebacteria bacterium]|nr:glycosyltransferase family 39 protein [Candidatus Paceibacterota bacterium]
MWLILIKQNFLIIVVLLVAFGLRLPLLNGSFWLDEAAQALESSRPFTQQLQIRADFQPPLIHFLTHFALYISSNEWWLRTVAALIPGLITIFAVYKVGEILFSSKVGLVSSILLATSSFHIFYSQELRPYSLPAMFGLLSWWMLLAIIYQRKNKLKMKLKEIEIKPLKLTFDRRIIFLIIFNILGLYSSYLYPFLLLSQLIYVWMMERQYIHKLIFSLVITSLSFLPWLPSFLGQLQEGRMVQAQLPGWDKVVSITQVKAIGLTFGKFIFGVLDINFTLLFIVTTIVLSLIVLAIYKDIDKKDLFSYFKNLVVTKTKSKKETLKPLFVLLIAFFVPLLAAWIISFWVPVLRPKRVLYLLPFFYLIISSTIVFAKKKLFANALIGILLLVNFYSTVSYYIHPSLQRENWRSLHDHITSLYPKEHSITIFSHPAAFSPWRWYDDGNYPEISTGTLHIDQVQDMKEKFKEINNYDYVLVFDYLRTLSDPQDKIIMEVNAYGYKQIDIINYPGIGFVRVFSKIDSVLSYHSEQF